jgi:uncharacterized DUF497 family protein
MPTRIAGFDWDEGNRAKCRKHGVNADEIEAVFRGSPRVLPDRTGNAEPRFNAVGLNAAGRHVFVVFTLRRRAEGMFLRPISARYMHREEVRTYERTRS